jgi:hypothetical protein
LNKVCKIITILKLFIYLKEKTEIIHISDDFLLHSNEIHYNDNNTFITVHYDENEEIYEELETT